MPSGTNSRSCSASVLNVVAILNESAPWFFHLIQEELWTTALFADSAHHRPSQPGRNLTIRNLPDIVDNAAAKIACRSWPRRPKTGRSFAGIGGTVGSPRRDLVLVNASNFAS
jgi:hypothetical protein